MNELESEVQQLIQIAGPEHHCILMRNNNGALKDNTGRLVRYGLGHVSNNQSTKSSDLIGITSKVITQDMVGQIVGIFTAVEVKRNDWKPSNKDERESHQRNFINWVISRGGIAGFANSVDSFKGLMKR